MRINYAHLRGFKRFHNSRIHEFEARFQSPVQVIIGANASGKSALLRELSPLPSVRTDFEPNGRKELHITHDGHQYVLISDFSNRVSPHSFIMDGTELNTSHTTDIQTELAAQHFGVTPAVRNLIYQKVQMTRTTKAERKALFLNINPMELGLILETHKKAQGKMKDCKANLQMLYARKNDLEGKMIPEPTLELHKITKERLNEQILALDKLIYGIEQHVHNLKDKFRDDLDYREKCSSENRQLIPAKDITLACKKIQYGAYRFAQVARGTDNYTEKEKLRSSRQNLLAIKEELSRSISSLSQEINEYQKHLDSTAERPISAIEKEIASIDAAMSQYKDLPENPIPVQLIPRHNDLLQKIRQVLFVFRDTDAHMVEPRIVNDKIILARKYHDQMMTVGSEVSQLKARILEEEKELEDNRVSAGIPSTCISTACGLRTIFAQRNTILTESYEKHKAELVVKSKELEELTKEFDELKTYLKPFVDDGLVEKYQWLLNALHEGYFDIRPWSEELIDAVNNQPMKIVADLEKYIEGSRLHAEYSALATKKNQLTREIELLMKSSGASLEFLQKRLKEKTKEVRTKLDKLSSVEKAIEETDKEYNLYLEYSETLASLEEYQRSFDRGERALTVSKAIQYWSELAKYFIKAKSSISEELRTLETLVREQDVLRQSYNNETMVLIKKIESEKAIYERIEMALSPTTGMPHKSMVKYLNVMINNVNYFISQIWKYRLHLQQINMDQPLDYGFRIEIGNDIANDINTMSDGQSEVMNLAWVLTILLQLKLLNKIPLFADEIGRTLDPIHRGTILTFLNQLIDNKLIEQLFVVNHFAALYDGFQNKDIICLTPDAFSDMPHSVNEYVKLS